MKKTTLLLVILVAVVLVVASLPMVISTDAFLQFCVRKASGRLPGTVSIGSWHVGWSDGLEAREIDYEDRAQGIHVVVPRLTCSQGLLAVLTTAGKDLGTIRMEKPLVELSAGTSRETGSRPSPSAEAGEADRQETPAREPEKKQSGGKPIWNELLVKLLLEDGAVLYRKPGGQQQVVVHALDLDAELTRGSLVYTLKTLPAGDTGWLSSKGKIDLPSRGDAFLDTLIGQVDMTASDFPVQDILGLAAVTADLPTGEGVLEGDWNVRMTGIGNISLRGNISLHDLALKGGFLGQDRPRFKEVLLSMDARRKEGREIELNRLDFRADPAEFTASGIYGPEQVEIRGQGQLDLPLLFAAFPHLLRLQPETRLDSGTLSLSLNMQRKEQRMTLRANAGIDQIRGVQGGQVLAWDAPLILDLEAEQQDKMFTVKTARLKAPFLELQGHGDLNRSALQADVDLRKASAEIGRLFKMPWRLGGNLHLTATSAAEVDRRFKVDTRMEVGAFTLSRDNELLLPAHPLTLDCTLLLPSPLSNASSKRMDLDLDLVSWLGTTHLKARDLKKSQGSAAGKFHLLATGGLGRITDLLHSLDLMPRAMTVTGAFRLAGQGSMGEDVVLLRGMELDLEDFVLHDHGKTYQDKAVRFSMGKKTAAGDAPVVIGKLQVYDKMDTFPHKADSSRIALKDHRLFLKDMDLSATGLNLSDTSLALADWREPLKTLSLKARGKADLGRLSDLLHLAGAMSPDLAISGKTSFDAVIDDRTENSRSMDLHAVIQALTVHRSARKILSEETVDLQLAATGQLQPVDLQISGLSLESALLTLDTKGKVQAENELELEGEILPDLQVLAAVIEQLTGTRIAMTGKKKSDFRCRIPLDRPGKERLQAAEARIELFAEDIEYLGCSLQKLTLPVRLEDGMMNLRLAGKFNDGKLDLAPKVDFHRQPAVLAIAKGSRFLQDVAIQKPLVEGLLQKIHPLFGVLARPSGRLSGRFDEFSWPLEKGGEQRARFTVVFDTSRIELDSSGVLRELLALAGLENQPLSLKESEITCIGKQGRITCTPLRILVAESEMKLSGSVGMDRTLDYLLEIPVTEKLVGREGYRVLAGTTIRVPIRGDAENPYYDGKALSEAISDLMAQAAGKAIEKQAEKILPDLFKGLFDK